MQKKYLNSGKYYKSFIHLFHFLGLICFLTLLFCFYFCCQVEFLVSDILLGQ